MAEKRRLFFALWPDAALRQAIAGAAAAVATNRAISGRRIPVERVHLTLLFLGDVAGDAEARLRAAAAAIRAPAFDLVLDQVGCFYRSRVFWVGASGMPEAMTDLWQHVRAAAEAAGIAPDRKPLAPHVTCLRDIKDRIRPVPIEPISWPVRDFALVHSALGANPEYHVVSHWPLHNAPMGSVKSGQSGQQPE